MVKIQENVFSKTENVFGELLREFSIIFQTFGTQCKFFPSEMFLTDFVKNYLFGKLSLNYHLIFAKFSLMKYDTLFILLILFYILSLNLDLTLLIRLKSSYQAFYGLKHYNLLQTGSFLIRKLNQSTSCLMLQLKGKSTLKLLFDSNFR